MNVLRIAIAVVIRAVTDEGEKKMRVSRSIRFVATGVLAVIGTTFGTFGLTVAAQPEAVPFVFIGTAADCSPSPPGSHIVTSAWLEGMGLPDNGGDAALNGVAATANDPHRGLLLSKNGPTPDCSSAGARITGVTGMPVGPTFALGFDYRNGGHCGAGATRFNVVVTPPAGPNTFHFVGGCSNDSTPTPAPQDPAEWTRVRFETSNPAEAFPVIPPGSTIVSISLLHDEGTDTPTVQSPNGVGLAVLDNIFINGQFIRSGRLVAAPPPCEPNQQDHGNGQVEDEHGGNGGDFDFDECDGTHQARHRDPDRSVDFHSTSNDGGPTFDPIDQKATTTGTGLNNGQPVTYTLAVIGLGIGPRTDLYSLTLRDATGALIYTRIGNLLSGGILVRR